jgi:hypothetical protein
MDNNIQHTYKALFGALIIGLALILFTVFTSCAPKIVNPGHPADPMYSKYADPVPQKAGQSK